MNHSDMQEIIDMAVKAATKAAMSGHPVERIVWCPPASGTSCWRGSMALIYCPPLTPSITPPWEQ